MPCACGDKNQNVNYIYTNPRGEQTSYKTDVQARAAQLRAGGGGSIRTEVKK